MRLQEFHKKHKEWLSNLNGDDVHSIWKQQSCLLNDYALFLTINDLIKEAARTPTEGLGINGSVLRLLVTGFYVSQATGIRRLTDRQGKDPSRHVISLRALLDDIRANRELLTREIYLASNGLPFDPAPAKQRYFDRIASTGQKFVFEGMHKEGPEAWTASERAHDRFDKLSETSLSGRSPEDLISLKCFDLLESKIKSCDDVRGYTNKFIAHAADPISRASLKNSQRRVALDRLTECHQVMVHVSCFIGGPILQDGFSTGVPVPQFDVLENLDRAWVSTEGLEKAREHWHQHASQIESWGLCRSCES